MTPSKINRTVAIGFAAVIATIAASPARADSQPADTSYASDTTYMGAAGCEKDFGYGRTLEACD